MDSFSWLEPVHLPHWPVQPVESDLLRYRISIPTHWSARPLTRQIGNVVQHAYCGPLPSEWCTIDYMAVADRTADIRMWQDSLVQLYGVPLPILSEPYFHAIPLLEWVYLGESSAYAERLGLTIEPVHLYTGLVQLPETPPELARIYVVLIQRECEAWKIAVTIASACLPGAPEDMVNANDHRRASAILGNLQLLPPGTDG